MLKFISSLIVSAALIYFCLVYSWLPSYRVICDKRAQLSEVRARLGSVRNTQNRFRVLSEQLAFQTKNRKEMETKLREDTKFSEINTSVRMMCRNHGLKLKNLSQNEGSETEFFIKSSYTITISGSYKNIENFFNSLAVNDIILVPENLSVSSSSADADAAAVFSLALYKYKK